MRCVQGRCRTGWLLQALLLGCGASPLPPSHLRPPTPPQVPRGPGSPPVPVMHSPPRPLTVKDQQDWKIPPCISNWKNAKVGGGGACGMCERGGRQGALRQQKAEAPQLGKGKACWSSSNGSPAPCWAAHRHPPTPTHPQGYTIPLDKRLAADGRGLQEVAINDQFAKFTEALYIAEQKVRR